MNLYGWKELAFYSVLGFGLAIWALQVNVEDGIPKREDLLLAEGNLEWMQEYKYGIRFGLSGVPRKFTYSSKSRAASGVRKSLENAGDSKIIIWYTNESHGPIFSNDRYHDVFSLTVGNISVRTYEETINAWRRNNGFAFPLGLAFLGIGFFLSICSWHQFRKGQR